MLPPANAYWNYYNMYINLFNNTKIKRSNTIDIYFLFG